MNVMRANYAVLQLLFKLEQQQTEALLKTLSLPLWQGLKDMNSTTWILVCYTAFLILMSLAACTQKGGDGLYSEGPRGTSKPKRSFPLDGSPRSIHTI